VNCSYYNNFICFAEECNVFFPSVFRVFSQERRLLFSYIYVYITSNLFLVYAIII